MRKTMTLWMTVLMLSISLPTMGAMSISKMRQNARFLTDRMAYELRLSPMQYDDIYEVNYDFINNIRYIMDDVVRGYPHAVERYYEYLNYRNDDLRWILSAAQYRHFMNADYFYRPVYTTATNWLFRIYRVYRNVSFFYFDRPHHYKTYKGGHFRTHFGNESYYKHHRKDHYRHEFFNGNVQLRPDKPQHPGNHRPDMPAAPQRPNGRPQARPGRAEPARPSTERPSNNRPSAEKPSKPQKTQRPQKPQKPQSTSRKVKKNDRKKEYRKRSTSSSRSENKENRRATRTL